MLSPAVFQALTEALGPDRVFTDTETLALYKRDETPRQVTPAAVLFPDSHDHVVALMQIANTYKLPVVPRGAGSGNVGGALPVENGLVVSFECMNRVLEFDPLNRLMVVEPGVITEDIGQLARTRGLFYAPDPGSGAYSRIGGNLAMNAAGPRAVKYGVTRDHVLGLKAVTGEGKTIVTGCRTSKGVTGYDFTRLLIGSEGTLVLITEATLKLLPAPETVATLRLCFDSNRSACEAVERVMQQPVLPCALEIMDRRSIEAVRNAPDNTGAANDLPVGSQALLMVEADGTARDVPHQIAALKETLQGKGLLEIREGFTREEAVSLWTARKSLSHAVKQYAPLKINEDVVVPVSRLADFIDFLDAQANRYTFPIVSFGHAGNGNLHVNLMVHPDKPGEMHQAHECLLAIVQTVLTMGGTLSGEHGIGTEKREYVSLEIPPDTLALMRAVKQQFDPHALLNPGKLFPDV